MPFAPVSQLIRPLCLLLLLGGGAIAVSRAADRPVRDDAKDGKPAASPDLRELFDSTLGAVQVIGEQKQPESQQSRTRESAAQTAPVLNLIGEWGAPTPPPVNSQDSSTTPPRPLPAAGKATPPAELAPVHRTSNRPMPVPTAPARAATAPTRPNNARPAFRPIPDDVEA